MQTQEPKIDWNLVWSFLSFGLISVGFWVFVVEIIFVDLHGTGLFLMSAGLLLLWVMYEEYKERTKKMNNETIMHLRLVNSEEIVADIVDETAESYLVKNPYVVIEAPECITLQKYVPFSENEVIALKKMHIVTLTALHPEMIRYYRNTMDIGKNSTKMAMVGLQHVNEMMEEFIHDGIMPNSNINMIDLKSFPTSNTLH